MKDSRDSLPDGIVVDPDSGRHALVLPTASKSSATLAAVSVIWSAKDGCAEALQSFGTQYAAGLFDGIVKPLGDHHLVVPVQEASVSQLVALKDRMRTVLCQIDGFSTGEALNIAMEVAPGTA